MDAAVEPQRVALGNCVASEPDVASLWQAPDGETPLRRPKPYD